MEYDAIYRHWPLTKDEPKAKTRKPQKKKERKKELQIRKKSFK